MQYEQLLDQLVEQGEVAQNRRTQTSTLTLFGTRLEYDLQKGFPLITSKKIHHPSVWGELLWFLSGSTNVQELREKHNTTIWDEWEGEDGTIGPMYGAQWRNAYWASEPGDEQSPPPTHRVDQITQLIQDIRLDPTSRRHILSAWNVGQLRQMALAPCHVMFQVHVNTKTGCMDLQVYQRSADMFLGVPFNLASYGALLIILAQETGWDPGRLVWIGGNTHLYLDHLHQAATQLLRHKVNEIPLPQLEITDKPFDKLELNDFQLTGYDPHPPIRAKVIV